VGGGQRGRTSRAPVGIWLCVGGGVGHGRGIWLRRPNEDSVGQARGPVAERGQRSGVGGRWSGR
jgi:hypothetical protein